MPLWKNPLLWLVICPLPTIWVLYWLLVFKLLTWGTKKIYWFASEEVGKGEALVLAPLVKSLFSPA